MFDVLRSRFVWIILLGFVVAQTSVAATVGQEREKLKNLQQSLTVQKQNLDNIQTEKQEYPAKIKEAQAELAKTQAEHDAAQNELRQLQTANANPDVDNSREIMLKEHAVKMAERGVSREKRTLERLERNLDNVDGDTNKIRSNISRLENQIAEQQQTLAEIQKQVQREQQVVAVPKPSAPPAPPIAPPKSEEIVVAKANVAPPAMETERPTVTTQPTEVQLPPLTKGELEGFEAAKVMTAELDAIKAKGLTETKKPLSLKGSDVADTPLNYVGEDHYLGEVAIVSGSQQINIDKNRFRITIPEGDDGETYVFVVDESSRKTRVVYYKKSLLAYIGTNPVVASETKKEAVKSAPQKSEAALSTTLVTLASGKTIELPEHDAYAYEIAKEQIAILDELKQEQGNDKPNLNNLTLSGSQIDGEINFQYLYQDQYQAEAKVQAGRQVIKINRGRYRIDIPEEDDGETYLFYVDANRADRLQITFFKKSILAYFQ